MMRHESYGSWADVGGDGCMAIGDDESIHEFDALGSCLCIDCGAF